MNTKRPLNNIPRSMLSDEGRMYLCCISVSFHFLALWFLHSHIAVLRCDCLSAFVIVFFCPSQRTRTKSRMFLTATMASKQKLLQKGGTITELTRMCINYHTLHLLCKGIRITCLRIAFVFTSESILSALESNLEQKGEILQIGLSFCYFSIEQFSLYCEIY